MPCSCKEQTGPFHSSPDYIYPGASPHSLTNNLSYSNRPKGSFLPFPPPTYLVSFIPFLTNLVSCWITPFFNPNYLIFSLFLFSVCLHICISNSIGRGWWYNISDNQIFCCNGKKKFNSWIWPSNFPKISSAHTKKQFPSNAAPHIWELKEVSSSQMSFLK